MCAIGRCGEYEGKHARSHSSDMSDISPARKDGPTADHVASILDQVPSDRAGGPEMT